MSLEQRGASNLIPLAAVTGAETALLEKGGRYISRYEISQTIVQVMMMKRLASFTSSGMSQLTRYNFGGGAHFFFSAMAASSS